MIVTCKKEIPARWIFFAVLPWAAFSFNSGVVGVAFLFSLKKFIENPAGLTFILSLPSFVSIVTAPAASFTSDRIWTRFGRRKPFVVTSWIGIITALVLMPLMPNFWSLLVVYMLYSLSLDLNLALEPLKQEIIPPHERGRATGMMAWFQNLGGIGFYFIAFGRFDDVSYMAGVPFAGEKAIYWSAAMLMAVMLMLVMLGIKELDQKSKLRGERLTPGPFVRGLLDPELRPIYLLVFSASALNAGLGPLGNLLYTEQWGYTKQQMGINVAVGGVINIFIIGLLTLLADRLNRMKAYQILISISLSIHVFYFTYVNFVLPDRHPSLVEIIVFGESGTIIALLTAMVYVPLVYDYVRRNKMGTYAAGAGMVTRLTNLVTLNGVGLFVWGYATLFQPAAGEMTRVVLREEQDRKDVVAFLREADWARPRDGSAARPKEIEAVAWQANGTFTEKSRTWEIRLSDKDGEKMSDRRKDLAVKQSWFASSERLLKDKAALLEKKGENGKALEVAGEVLENRGKAEALTSEIGTIDTELARRSESFSAQVEKVLGDRMLREGEQVRAASLREAVLVEIPAARRPGAKAVEKGLESLRRECPEVIDLRPLKTEAGYALVVSLLPTSGAGTAEVAALAEKVREAAMRATVPWEPGLFAGDLSSSPVSLSRQTALVVEVLIVEDPVETYVSPITRGVNRVMAAFDAEPAPRRKLDAIARNLRLTAGTGHVRIDPGATPKTLDVVTLLPAPQKGEAGADLAPALAARLAALIGAEGVRQPGALAEAGRFYERLEIAAAAQKITLARPRLVAAYAPIKYDYMSGYIWMFMLSTIGITLTFIFRRMERQGKIRKRGVEEEHAS